MMTDLIDRAKAIAELKCEASCGDRDYEKGLEIAVDILELFPSAEPRWIPVTERLPLKPGFYMVTVGAPYKPVRVYEYSPCEGYENENLWKGEDGAYVFNWFVEAWQNLPEPWKGDDRL